jgi:hypothetical protein
MKTSILILAVVLNATLVVGQSHQEKIIKFVDKHNGKRVGKGVCYELIQGAVRTYNRSYEYNGVKREWSKNWEHVDMSNAIPGDVIVLSGGTKRHVSHVCIVYKIDGDNIYVAEQNVEPISDKNRLKHSHVVIRLLDFENIEDRYGKINYDFYRTK